MGETRVDLQHLLEDLRDAYTGALEETILTEITANALDSGATRIRFQPNAGDGTLTVVDDGRGMQRRDLARYHNVAASTKSRGEGIGFAGVGIKLGLLVADEVVTETRRGKTHVATTWHLASRYRAPWKWMPPPGLAGGRGTAVRLRLNNPLSPLLDAGYLEEALRHHFAPLLDSAFDELLRRHYPEGIAFEVDALPLKPVSTASRERVTIPIRLGRKRLPSAIAVLERHTVPLPDDQHGIAVSTFGKVIKGGWDWLGLTPATPFRISAVVEAPDLAACLTLSKNDFVRTGPRGATYLAYRKAIQEVVSRQLNAWGDARDEARPRTIRLERDLERVLEDLADDFPLLRSLVDQRAGGQNRLPLPGRGSDRVPGPLFADLSTGTDADGHRAAALPQREDPPGEPGPPGDEMPTPPSGPGGESVPSEPSAPADADGESGDGGDERVIVGTLATVSGRRRPARYGLLVQFEARPEDSELGRLVDSTIWINEAHPAYVRATVSRSGGYHTALTVAMALAPLAVGSAGEHAFITRFLSHWGDASRKTRKKNRSGRKRTKEKGAGS
ncbi:MAG: ATP-binding protein [Acidobacteria bacterium]|nr:ATP-binding protein [Acidobacteriota bacterium]MBA3886249.1 ATP-binding protein [Acidobacteriota bacterium]